MSITAGETGWLREANILGTPLEFNFVFFNPLLGWTKKLTLLKSPIELGVMQILSLRDYLPSSSSHCDPAAGGVASILW